ncbi:PH domain-containing protein [Cellulomonas sp. APG4]|uniref:PH domain-containing protein n=1 Tax=Cellulomonas sp. APG4 TaxID=1538656 RepID=UPI001379CD89|nr:PH domain-containing protein [Cellulomonas sp. APG4]
MTTPHPAPGPHAPDALAAQPGVADPAPDAPADRWRRVHPVTPAVRGWKVIVVLLVVLGQQVSQNVVAAREAIDAVGWLPVLGLVVVVALIGFGYSAIAWRMTRYAIDDEAVYLHTGVLFRQQRSARLDRIQAIDVVQPVLARIFGLAELKIEVAGGSDSAVALAFLKEADAQAVRNEILARAAGVRFGTPEQPEAPVAPERPMVAVPPGRLVSSLVRSSATFWAVVAVAVVTVTAITTRSVGSTFAMLPVLAGTIGYLWQRFAGEFGFRSALSPDGIRLRRGLLETRTQTVPPGRVQAVRLTQPLLWRGPDWWRVQVNVAGYGQGDGTSSTETVLLPVGDRDEALATLWLVVPDLGVADARALLDVALAGQGPDGGFTTSPRRARWLDPLSWRREGFVVTPRALLARSGRFVRRLVVVPHERTQSLGLVQGPLQRRLGLASFTLHSTPGPVAPRVDHLDAAAASELMTEQAARARAARAAAGPERWMSELAAAQDDPAGEARPS